MTAPGAISDPWFIVARSPGRIRGYPANWKGWVTLFGCIFGSVACGLGAGYLWFRTHQWLWFAGYFATIFPGSFVLLFTVMHRTGREVFVPQGTGSVPQAMALAMARAQAGSLQPLGLTLEAIDHVQVAIPTGGEEEARRFYGYLLGLPERAKPPELAARGGCWFESATVKVHCGVEDPFSPARKAHIAFRVDDVRDLAARARASGYDVADDDALPGHDRIYINDPFGNRLEFLRPL